MSRTVDELVAFVNDNLAYNERAAEQFKKNPFKAKRHVESADSYREILSILTAPAAVAEAHTPPVAPESAPKQLRLWLLPEELDGVPSDLMQELSASSIDKTELAIYGILEARGGIASLDQILVGLYRSLGEIHKRTTLTSRLYRMTQRKQIFSIPNKKGVYANREIGEAEASKLFGDYEDA